jgi:hypothetical protein
MAYPHFGGFGEVSNGMEDPLVDSMIFPLKTQFAGDFPASHD